MSAYIVDEEHIRYLVNAGLSLNTYGKMTWYSHGTAIEPPRKLGELHDGNASEIGMMLWRENRASVDARYREENLPMIYTHDRPGAKIHAIDPVQVLKSISCYEYQTCEHNGWYESVARAFCEGLRGLAINKLPGYDAAAWGCPGK